MLVCAIFGCSSAPVLAQLHDLARASVLQVRAYHSHGRAVWGSAVAIAPGKLVTNSHVAHGAVRIEVMHAGRIVQVTQAAHDSARDLCLLDAPAVDVPPATSSGRLEPGQKVYAVGFPADQGLRVTNGQVVALHDYDGAEVIQVSAPFEYGASGGALFDDQGRLVGILAFKARAGGSFHFALPVAWLKQTVKGSEVQYPGSAVAFWQRTGDALPYFLRAVSFEATHNWAGLTALAHEWTRQQPTNRGAWNALAKAQLHSNKSPVPSVGSGPLPGVLLTSLTPPTIATVAVSTP